jgi:hypothetical protein
MGRDFAETKLLFPVVTASAFSASFLVSLCPRVAVAGIRSSWSGNYKNLGYKACEMLKPKFGSLNPQKEVNSGVDY